MAREALISIGWGILLTVTVGMAGAVGVVICIVIPVWRQDRITIRRHWYGRRARLGGRTVAAVYRDKRNGQWIAICFEQADRGGHAGTVRDASRRKLRDRLQWKLDTYGEWWI